MTKENLIKVLKELGFKEDFELGDNEYFKNFIDNSICAIDKHHIQYKFNHFNYTKNLVTSIDINNFIFNTSAGKSPTEILLNKLDLLILKLEKKK